MYFNIFFITDEKCLMWAFNIFGTRDDVASTKRERTVLAAALHDKRARKLRRWRQLILVQREGEYEKNKEKDGKMLGETEDRDISIQVSAAKPALSSWLGVAHSYSLYLRSIHTYTPKMSTKNWPTMRKNVSVKIPTNLLLGGSARCPSFNERRMIPLL